MIKKLKDNLTGEKTPFLTIVEYGRVGNSLRFKFTCSDSKLFSAYSEHNEPIYRGDVVEVFICTGKDICEYYELEVAPNGATFFAKVKNKNGLHLTFLDKTFTSKVEITEKGYDVEIIIPFKSIEVGEEPIRFNAYRIETEGGHENLNLLALNPTMKPLFHVPEKFIPFPMD